MKLIVLAVLFYFAYKVMIVPLLSSRNLVDTTQWKNEEEGEFVEYEEVIEEKEENK